MKVRFREFYDEKPGLNNLYLPIKCTRIFIRYFTRLMGYDISQVIFLIIVRLLNTLEKFFDVAYITYLFKINIYQIKFRRTMASNDLLLAVGIKNEWAEYVIMKSKSMMSRLNAKLYLSLLSRHRFYKKKSPYIQSIINPILLNKSTEKKFYIYGPNANSPPNHKYKEYVLVVLKPIDFNLSHIREKLLFVNGAYYLSKMVDNKGYSQKLVDIYGKVIVSNLSEIDSPLERANIPMFGNIAGPMALGRIIYNLLYRYGRFTCVIEGFDLYTYNKMYSSYYPSLAREKERIDERLICDSLAVHDALYNFLYVKELCKYLKILDSDNFKKIYKRSGDWYLSRLQKIRNFELLKNS